MRAGRIISDDSRGTMTRSVLYTFYTRIMDLFGHGQVLAYALPLTLMGHRITLWPFQKPDAKIEQRNQVYGPHKGPRQARIATNE